MSNYFSVICLACNEQPDFDGINHGDVVIRDFWRMRHLIAQMQELDSQGYLEANIMAHGYTLPHWLGRHHEHDIRLRDEYGYLYDWETLKREEHAEPNPDLRQDS